ncbi:fimbrial protein [Neisseriaceae bacterium TC5R-5]|nr:fimbrial protein [Neisseriaceae bacterium TC5R-5]
MQVTLFAASATSSPLADNTCVNHILNTNKDFAGGPLNYILPVRPISVDPNLPLGSILATWETDLSLATALANDFTMRCPANASGVSYDMSGVRGIYNGTVAYSTNVPGIGVIISLRQNAGGYGAGTPFPIFLHFPSLAEKNASSVLTEIGGVVKFSLIKTSSAVTAGTLSGTVGSIYISAPTRLAKGTFYHFVFGSGGSISPKAAATCDVAVGSRDFTVTLPVVSVSDFAGNHSSAGNKPFNLVANCEGSGGALQLKMHDVGGSNSSIGILNPAAGTIAQNVRLQLRRHSDCATDMPLNDVAMDIATVANGSQVVTVPLCVRYIQNTAMAPTAGLIHGQAKFTLAYP